jgi:hypothetical protein
MSRFSRVFFSLIIAILLIGFPSPRAGWLLNDIPVCTDVAQQQKPVIAPDGEEGSFVAWEDARSNNDVFIQRYDTDGNALWAANGINLSETEEGAQDPAILPDGEGGAFVVFLTDSSFCMTGGQYCDFFYTAWCSRMSLARIAPDGSILWKKHLAPISPTGLSNLISERYDWMFDDGEGGVVIIWEMSQGYSANLDCDPPTQPCSGSWAPFHLYAQRIDAQGNRLWGAMPVSVCPNASLQGSYGAARDESGNIFVAWTDLRNEGYQYGDIYAQKMDADGNVLWAPAGAPVIMYTAKQIAPYVVPDGSGSVFIAWKDHRSALNPDNIHIYAQRLDRSGNAAWAPEGILITDNFGPKNVLGITASTPGSCIIFWANGDYTYGGSLYAHRIDTTGSELWQAEGLPVSEGSSTAVSARGIPAEDGGAVFAWEQEGLCYDGCAFRAIWGTSANDIFAAGDRGNIYHYDGTSWSYMENPAKYYPLYAMWGTAPDNVYAAGSAYIVHYNGYAWHSESNPAGYYSVIRGIWGSGPDDIYAVGPGILHFDGRGWSKVDSTGDWSLYGVHGNSSTDIYAIGDNFIVHYDGSRWTRTNLPYSSLRGIWVSPENHIFIPTYEGMIHNDGSGWATLPLGANFTYGQSVWGDGSGNVYAVFNLGYVLHYNGTTATTIQIAPWHQYMYGIWGTAGNDMWTCGYPRSVRHFDGSEWTSVYETSGTLYMNKVDSAGNPLWNEDGAPVTTGYAEQTGLALTSDGYGNALLAWRDSRSINWNIYARKVSFARGPIVATELMSFDASRVGAGISVSWQLFHYDEGSEFSVSRAAGSDIGWTEISPAISRDDLTFSFVDSTVEAPARYRYRVRVGDDAGSRILFETDAIAVPAPPLALDQNFPNPFNPATTIRYCLPARCRVSLRIYDVSGRLIADLIDQDQTPGRHSITWNGEDTHGRRTASGIYFCRLRAGKQVLSRKMVLLR